MDEDIDQLRQRMEQANLFAYIRNAEGDEQFYQEMREAQALIGALDARRRRAADIEPVSTARCGFGAAQPKRDAYGARGGG